MTPLVLLGLFSFFVSACAHTAPPVPPDTTPAPPMIHFPDYSQPVTASQTELIHPSPFIPAKIRIGYFHEAFTELTRYQLIQGDSIEPLITIQSRFSWFPLRTVELDVGVYDNQDQELLKIPVELIEESTGKKVYHGSVTPLPSEFRHWSEELNLSVKITLNESRMTRLFDAFLYIHPIATLSQKEPAYIDGAHLIIPVEVRGQEKGFYFLDGILFSEKTREPLIYLAGKTQIHEEEGGTAVLHLKAHIQALRYKKEEGPYYFRPNRLERMRNFLGDIPRQGSPRVDPPIRVPRFPFSAYSN